jgi:hypothetical protein
MYSPRKIESSPNWQDSDGTKIYTISAKNSTVEHSKFHDRLQKVKENYSFSWDTIPSFAIFHEGILDIPVNSATHSGNILPLFLTGKVHYNFINCPIVIF